MSAKQASSRAVIEARGLLRALAAAQQTYTLYPDRHPNRREAVGEMLGLARRLVEEVDEVPVLFVARRSFYIGSTLMARESLSLNRLLTSFETAEIEAVEILPRVSEGDIDALVRLLLGEEGARQELEGLAINRIRPSLPGQHDERERALSDMLHTYASGLELLRQTASKVAAGRPVDLESTKLVVEQLAEHVSADPVQALLVTTVKSFDEYTYYHMLNVCMLSIALGYAVGLRRDQVVLLGLGALLHDVGKVKVPRDVLQHPGSLSEEQWRMIQRHPVDGAGLVFVTTRDLFHPAASIVLEHHSAFDLSGYPNLTERPHPSLPARLVAVTDCFDAVTSKRTYREAEDRRQALSILMAGSGHGYDPRVVGTFSRLLGLFPIGSLVRLSSGAVGMVVRNNEQHLSRPVVRLVLDAGGSPCDPEEVDLAQQGTDGNFMWEVVETMDPEEMGIDMATLLQTGRAEERAPDDEAERGLVHEPGFGETPPEGYVEAHDDHVHEDAPEVDAEMAPPFPD